MLRQHRDMEPVSVRSGSPTATPGPRRTCSKPTSTSRPRLPSPLEPRLGPDSDRGEGPPRLAVSWSGSESSNQPVENAPDIVVFPAFNDTSGGTWVNVPGQGFLSPFLPGGLADGEAYLLDGTRLGPTDRSDPASYRLVPHALRVRRPVLRSRERRRPVVDTVRFNVEQRLRAVAEAPPAASTRYASGADSKWTRSSPFGTPTSPDTRTARRIRAPVPGRRRSRRRSGASASPRTTSVSDPLREEFPLFLEVASAGVDFPLDHHIAHPGGGAPERHRGRTGRLSASCMGRTAPSAMRPFPGPPRAVQRRRPRYRPHGAVEARFEEPRAGRWRCCCPRHSRPRRYVPRSRTRRAVDDASASKNRSGPHVATDVLRLGVLASGSVGVVRQVPANVVGRVLYRPFDLIKRVHRPSPAAVAQASVMIPHIPGQRHKAVPVLPRNARSDLVTDGEREM